MPCSKISLSLTNRHFPKESSSVSLNLPGICFQQFKTLLACWSAPTNSPRYLIFFKGNFYGKRNETDGKSCDRLLMKYVICFITRMRQRKNLIKNK